MPNSYPGPIFPVQKRLSFLTHEIINRWKKSENLTLTDAFIKERKIKQQELIISENSMARIKTWFTKSYVYTLKEIISIWKKNENLTFTDAFIKERKIKQQELIISENNMARIKTWFTRSYFYTLKETKLQVFKLWIKLSMMWIYAPS